MINYIKKFLFSFLFFFIIFSVLSLIYTIVLFVSNSSFTFNSFLINNNFFPYFIGLITFFLYGIIVGLKNKKLLVSFTNSLLCIFIIFIIKILNDEFSFSIQQLVKYLSYEFIFLFGSIIGQNINL